MTTAGKLFMFVLTFLAWAASAHAQSPREQLQQMVEQLQKTPNDNALREKIINLAATLKPSPALPDTAVAFEGRARFAFESAQSEADFVVAVREYEKAVAAAPWVPGYYSDLCTIYQKAGKFEDAKRNCGFYLIGLSDPVQMTDVKRRIAGLDFGIEKANSPRARAEKVLAALKASRYAGPVTEILVCGVKLNNGWSCSEAEARGTNWVDILRVPEFGMRNPPNPVEFDMVDAEKGIVRFVLPGQVYVCGKVKGEGLGSVEWDTCEERHWPGESYFATSGSGRATFTSILDCGSGSRAADSCTRKILVFR